MAGASINVTFQDAQFRRALTRLRLDPARKQGLLRAIGVGLQHATMDRFETATTPAGVPWAALNPAYASTKRGPGILREAGMRGGLQGSITFSTTSDSVIVGSNRVYAAIHQFGGVIRPKNKRALVFMLGGRRVFAGAVRIPARPYLGFGPADQVAVLDAMDVLVPGWR